ncbi:hypothetical protein Q7P37_003418 [Cladosporium fusiforme]
MDRTTLNAKDVVALIWQHLDLPPAALTSLQLPGHGLGAPSSFKLGILAQASIALSALSAAQVHSITKSTTTTENQPNALPTVTVPLQNAIAEFKSAELLTLDGANITSPHPPLGGLHKTSDGYIRIHDGFLVHREKIKALLGCPGPDDRAAIAEKVSHWAAIDLENAAIEAGLAAAALRSYEQWDCLPQARAISAFPITIRKIADGPPGVLPSLAQGSGDKCLRGLRVVEMTRVIAGPVAGRTLAAHGADVLWVTSPNLEDQPSLDRDMARGKRTLRLDIANSRADRQELENLLAGTDVFLQSYRPGSLARKGLSAEELVTKSSSSIIIASLSAYGPTGPWSQRRGFDSLVQTCSGMNTSEAWHHSSSSSSSEEEEKQAARPLPCQALDHASGYFLATGIAAAAYKQATSGGSYEVSVSLAGTMKFLRSLGQYDGTSGFACAGVRGQEDVDAERLEERESGFGRIRALKHAAEIEGVDVGWDVMPKPLGSDRAEWLAGVC